MNHDKTVAVLAHFRLSKTEAEIYLFLLKRGRQRAKTVVEGLDLPKQTVYRSLNRLVEKKIITIGFERAKLFSARSFEEITKSQIENKIIEAENLQKSGKQILSIWHKIMGKNSLQT